MTAAVQFKEVRKDYHSVQALKGVDFAIEQGEFFGLLGPNGAGKSTLINIMAGLVKATSGRISVLGHDVVSQYRQSRAALGVVPQELVYDPFFTVREMLRLQSGYFGFGRENDVWIDELLDVLDLSHKANDNLHDLSGGMKRRVLIAQAMVHKPQVVVLDEPTAGVDVELRMALWEFTRRLHGAGHTIVLTTHYLEEAESLCDRIAILHHGELRALDTKQALLGRHPYRLLCLTLDRSDRALPSAVERLVIERDGAAVTLRLHKLENQIGPLLDSVKQAGIGIVDLRTRDMGLEDIFLELTREVAA
ncbi:MAG TPA: ABC transporter ATP-binding protein [Gammaproteobacteria bacterium]|nr:ABC transporter ATP-binding protein [Gammaproteobacteria bacterium]